MFHVRLKGYNIKGNLPSFFTKSKGTVTETITQIKHTIRIINTPCVHRYVFK